MYIYIYKLEDTTGIVTGSDTPPHYVLSQLHAQG